MSKQARPPPPRSSHRSPRQRRFRSRPLLPRPRPPILRRPRFGRRRPTPRLPCSCPDGTLPAQRPHPPAATLPHPVSLPSPAWKPLHLPSAAAPSEAAAKPIGAPNAEAANPAPVASLPPLGPAVEVATPPTPPPITALAPPLPHAAEPPPERSLELSDLWHPYRAVKKGLNWAGDQLPVIGGDDCEARAPANPPRRG